MDSKRELSALTERPWWHSKAVRGVAFALILIIGLTLRLWKLSEPILWCDEAESCINAMTILEHGVPTDRYLGLPIYENTLTDPWPESAEYEFRDSSYSKKGLAIYHGWLPLYSIAGSFKLFGIHPDTDTTVTHPVHNEDATRLRTIAARVPSVIFGMVFLIFLFLAGAEMFGPAAGWTAMLCASVAVPMVNIARQARYYSLTACMSAACCLAAWRLYSRGRYRDFVFAGIVYAMLFHTHLLTFAIASASFCVLVPGILKNHQAAWRKLFLFGAIIAVATVPWLLLTGFVGAAQSVPKAIHMIKLPQDLIAWPRKYWQISAFLVGGMAWITLLQFRGNWIPRRWRQPFIEHRAAFFFLSAWVLWGFLLFMFLIPAASLFFQRLYLGAVGPGIILGAMLFSGFGRAIGGKTAAVLACIGFVSFAYFNTKAGYWWQRNKVGQSRLTILVENIDGWRTRPGTRFYATPNDHLTLTFYTGMPFQSIAPVRKTFLDNYPGDIVLIDCMVHVFPISHENVREVSDSFKTPVAEADTEAMADLINRVAAGRKIRDRVREVVPRDPGLPKYAESIVDWQLSISPRWVRKYDFQYTNPAMFRGYDFDDLEKWWQVFFYRFVNPTARIGENLNYADRMRRGDAKILPTLWTVYLSPGTSSGEQATGLLGDK